MPKRAKKTVRGIRAHRSLAKALGKYKPQIYLALLVAYVILLALGTISEVFHLGWFRWLGP